MKKHFSYLSVLFCLFFVPTVWGKIPQNRVVPTIETDRAEFGLFNPPESGKPFAPRYFKFCKKMKLLAEKVKSFPTQPDDRPLLKRIDEYNYSKYTKGWI